jgi:HSP20 family protein
MRDRFDRMLIVFGSALNRSSEACWRPAADIYRTRTGWLIKYDLAGVRPEDVEITLGRSEITISGARRDWQLENGCSHYSMEIFYNRFERTLALPGDLHGAEIGVQSRDGILLLRLTCRGEIP